MPLIIFPHIFANESGNVPASQLDDNFNASAPSTVMLPVVQASTLAIAQIELGVQEVLDADRTYYLNETTGNDSNDGSAGAPWKTRQHAWYFVIYKIDLNGHTVTFQLVGNFTDNFSAGGHAVGQISPAQLIFQGTVSDATAVRVSVNGGGCWFSADSCSYTIQWMTIGGGVGALWGIIAAAGLVQYGNLIFDTCSDSHIRCSGGLTQVQRIGPNTTIGGAKFGRVAEVNGSIYNNGSYVETFTGTPTFSYAYVQADDCGFCSYTSCTFSGTFIGPRYRASSGGGIDTGGNSSTFFPGTIAGEVLGGYYFGAYYGPAGTQYGNTDPISIFYTEPTRTVLTSGSGTYTTPLRATRLNVRMVGGGGGSGGSGSAAGASGGNGGNTTFGGSLTSGGGTGSSRSGSAAAGGTATGGDINLAGGAGGQANGASGAPGPGGGVSVYGGAGSMAGSGTAAVPGTTNTGGGAGGAGGAGGGVVTSGGGGAGAYLEKLIVFPSATYAYAVGAGGTAGAAGTGGSAGAAGGSGIIIVDVYYD